MAENESEATKLHRLDKATMRAQLEERIKAICDASVGRLMTDDEAARFADLSAEMEELGR